MREQWKVIADFPDYKISNKGRVYSSLTYRILKPRKHSKGYYNVALFKDGQMHQKLIHRLVAEAFIPCDNKSLVVNHKDENKRNNKVDNLEWVTRSENASYSKSELGARHSYPVGKTGERYIHNSKNGFRVIIKRKKFHREANFPTLEQAVAYRRELLGA